MISPSKLYLHNYNHNIFFLILLSVYQAVGLGFFIWTVSLHPNLKLHRLTGFSLFSLGFPLCIYPSVFPSTLAASLSLPPSFKVSIVCPGCCFSATHSILHVDHETYMFATTAYFLRRSSQLIVVRLFHLSCGAHHLPQSCLWTSLPMCRTVFSFGCWIGWWMLVRCSTLNIFDWVLFRG